MNSMSFYLNLRFLPSMGSRIARARKFQTSMIVAVALCAAVLAAGTPAFAATRNATPAHPSNGSQMAPTISPEEAAAQHQTLKYAAVMAEGEFLRCRDDVRSRVELLLWDLDSVSILEKTPGFFCCL